MAVFAEKVKYCHISPHFIVFYREIYCNFYSVDKYQLDIQQCSFDTQKQVIIRGVARLFKMRGGKGGSRVSRGADWDSKWRLSIDLCAKCNFIWGQEGGRVSAWGRSPPPPGYATGNNNHLSSRNMKMELNIQRITINDV